MASRSTIHHDIIHYLIDHPSNLGMLQVKFNLGPYSIRDLMDRAEAAGIIEKRKVGTVVYYHVKPEWKRKAPLFTYTTSKGTQSFSRIDELLKFYGKQTNVHTAINFLPVLVAKLLHIGYRYNQAFEEHAEETVTTPLNRELKALSLELKTHQGSLKKLQLYLKQLELNDDLWTLEGLASHFNTQLDNDKRSIPPLTITEAIIIIENERNNQ